MIIHDGKINGKELKPCPFCQELPRHTSGEAFFNNPRTRLCMSTAYIRCECGCMLELESSDSYEETMDRLIKKWNYRGWDEP